ncbi:DivIVA domain-containing protein [Micromonospora fluostatini]|uniref:DivIVA domain-containing protein n=1 Tax=Micromonospora sp. JCM 30529 TaxID=3421643 RepID=UPI003D1861B2
MRSRLKGRRAAPSGERGKPDDQGVYRSAYVPVRPWQVRWRRFRTVGLFRRGLDPVDVHEFLRQVADDLTVLYDRLEQGREETGRFREALRAWQSEHAREINQRTY